MSLAQEVVITLSNGGEYSHKVKKPKGDAQNPMTDEEVSAKFHDCTRLSLPPAERQAVLETVQGLESLGDISKLMNRITYMTQSSEGER
jgi:2-methylcitrate dehydratase PrpD